MVAMQGRIDPTMLWVTTSLLMSLVSAQAVTANELFRCRQNCYEKFVQDWHHCMDYEDCKTMCIAPPNINNYIPEAFSFLCWNNCDQQLGSFVLNINSTVRQGSLVLTDIVWDQAITNASKQCLVTWEVSGGGLMGNLLTDGSTVELSLWPDTVYHVQVTCMHKDTGGMRRSLQLIVDTRMVGDSVITSARTVDTAIQAPLSEVDSRMRILKDSSKDNFSDQKHNDKIFQVGLSASSSQSSSPASSTVVTESVVVRSNIATGGIMINSTSLLMQSIFFAGISSLILFIGLTAVFMMIKPAHKNTSQNAHEFDREFLIHRKMLLSQTPATIISYPTSSGYITTSMSKLTIGETQVMHV